MLSIRIQLRHGWGWKFSLRHHQEHEHRWKDGGLIWQCVEFFNNHLIRNENGHFDCFDNQFDFYVKRSQCLGRSGQGAMQQIPDWRLLGRPVSWHVRRGVPDAWLGHLQWTTPQTQLSKLHWLFHVLQANYLRSHSNGGW
jgi:hypothetical protein